MQAPRSEEITHRSALGRRTLEGAPQSALNPPSGAILAHWGGADHPQWAVASPQWAGSMAPLGNENSPLGSFVFPLGSFIFPLGSFS